MAVTSEDTLIAARLAGDRFVIDKASNASQTANSWSSLWLSTGNPAAGTAPTTAAICTKALTGAIPFTNAVAPAKTYLSDLTLVGATASQVIEVWDRVAHMGGLSLTSIVSQTVGLDLTAGGLNPSAARVPAMSEIEFWLETYADGGATASNATVSVTYTDDTTANLSVIAVGGTLRARRLFRLNDYRQAADASKVIQDVNTVILSQSTTGAGNFGFTATRRMSKPIGIRLANFPEERDYQSIGLFEVPADACLMLGMFTVATATGVLRGPGVIARG